MGNKQPVVDTKISQLSTIRNNQRFLNPSDRQQFLDPVYCCCFRIGVRSYELWRRNLENHLKQLDKAVVWIPYLKNAYRNNRHNRQEDLHELYNMRLQWEQRSDTRSVAPNIDEMLQRSILVGGSSLSKKSNQNRKSVSIKQRSVNSKSIIISRNSRTPIKPINRQSSLQNISQIFASKKFFFDKQTSDSLYLFTLFCDLVQKHFKVNDTLFYCMKDTFIDYVANNNFGNQPLIMDLHQFIKLLWQTVVEYYKVDELDTMSGENSFFTQQNMETLATSILFRNSIIHARVFQLFVNENMEKQRELEASIYKLRDVTPQKLQIKPPYCLTQSTIKWFEQNHNYQSQLQPPLPQPYHVCILKMRQLQDTRTPAGKLKLLVNIADLITDCINKFYQKRNMQTKLKALDADQVLSIYSYILIKSRVKNLHSHLNIIQLFSSQGQLLSQTGYYYSVVSTALQSLTTVTL